MQAVELVEFSAVEANIRTSARVWHMSDNPVHYIDYLVFQRYLLSYRFDKYHIGLI